MPMIRADQADLVYKTEEAKYDAVVDDIVERHDAGQPVLVGTVCVEKSEYLSPQLKPQRRHARGAQREAARPGGLDRGEAGRKGAVTVATNMAGRGTDIMLGGNAEFLAVAALEARGLDPEENAEEYEAARAEALEAAEEPVAAGARRGRSSSAGSTSSAPSGTSPGASTTSCVDGPAARATRASPASTSPSRTT